MTLNIKNYIKLNNRTGKKKIGLIIGGETKHYNACSYIRLLSPLNELFNKYELYIIDNNSFEVFYKDIIKDNVLLETIIIQRDIFDRSNHYDFKTMKILFKKLKKNNIKIIFDIDDDLLNIDKTHIAFEKYNNLKELLKYIIINSDTITVPNIILKNQLQDFNKNIIIIPNTLMKLWHFQPYIQNNASLIEKEKIKIGYFGSNTHGEDIQIIKKAIINVQNHFSNEITFEIVGICNKNYKWINRINIPHNYKSNPTVIDNLKNLIFNFLSKYTPLKNNLPYPQFINWLKNEIEWDLSIAPLEDTNINQSKSNLKYLEYTAMNIPGIYSNIGPYKEINKKNSGLVVNNNINEWENAIIKLIENDELYRTILKNAHEDIKKNYQVENASLIWEKIL